MATTYHAPGGQQIRQNQDYKNNVVVIEKRETNYVETSRTDGADSFTGEMWSSSIDSIKAWAKAWSNEPTKLRFTVKD